jgi:hypothetical protein
MPSVIEMPPTIWGPFFWNTIHIMTLAYPKDPDEQTQQAAKNFFYSLQYLLPCDICKEHYKKHLEEDPPVVSSQKEIILYAFNLHNKVNKDLGKSVITYGEFMTHIRSLSKSSNFEYNTTNMMYVLLGIVAIGSFYYYLKKK